MRDPITRRPVSRRSVLKGGLTLLAGTTLGTRAIAADFPVPNKPIRILVGFPAGGGTDIQARIVAQFLSPILNAPVVVENRPGAGTMLAAAEVVRAAPDGHTLMYTPTSTLGQLPQTLVAAKYDPFKDFTSVAQAALGPTVLVLHKSIPATNVKELVAYAKAHPGELNYVSTGIGTAAHFFGAALSKHAGVDMVHVPYKGANDVSKDFIAGRVHLQFASSSAAAALQKSGQVRLLAVVAPKRSSLFPDLPTMGELGYPGMDIGTGLGFIGPAGVSPQVVAKISDGIRQVMDMPKVRDDFRQGGVEPQWLGPDDFMRTIAESYQTWGRMISDIGYRKE